MFCLLILSPSLSTLFPYTTLFRSLSLWCADGMRSFRLSELQRVRFLNPALESEVRKALEVLATGHDSQKKSVSLSFSGTGDRKSTRLNSSHQIISYAVFCLKKKTY